jgi:hypothetical protein
LSQYEDENAGKKQPEPLDAPKIDSKVSVDGVDLRRISLLTYRKVFDPWKRVPTNRAIAKHPLLHARQSYEY